MVSGLFLGMMGVITFLLLLALAVLSFVFWIMMLVDCAQRKFKNENDKIIWVLVIIFVHIIGAAVYYFVVKKNEKKRKRRK